jgi:hypothetical protein
MASTLRAAGGTREGLALPGTTVTPGRYGITVAWKA